MSAEQWDELAEKAPDGLIELEPDLSVRARVWGAFRTLSSIPEFGIPFIHEMTGITGSYQDAARWLDMPANELGESPAELILKGRLDLAQEALEAYHKLMK